MILAGQWNPPLPERPRTLDEASDRGWDSESVLHDRTPVETDAELVAELMAALSRQVEDIRRLRDADHEWRSA